MPRTQAWTWHPSIVCPVCGGQTYDEGLESCAALCSLCGRRWTREALDDRRWQEGIADDGRVHVLGRRGLCAIDPAPTFGSLFRYGVENLLAPTVAAALKDTQAVFTNVKGQQPRGRR